MLNKNKKSHLVVQSNKLIEARYSLTLGEQRLILAMVSMIHPNDADFFDYKISMKNLAELLNIDVKSSYREANKITERLMERILHIQKPGGGCQGSAHILRNIRKTGGRVYQEHRRRGYSGSADLLCRPAQGRQGEEHTRGLSGEAFTGGRKCQVAL
jgi:hypothetical protein